MRSSIHFFFDVLSPYFFISFETLLRYRASQWPVKVVLRPVSLPAIFKLSGNTSPAFACPARADHTAVDLALVSRHYGVPINVPYKFVDFAKGVKTKEANKLIVATQKMMPDKAEVVARALFSRIWIENKHVDHVQDFKKVLKGSGIEKWKDLLEESRSEKIDQEYKKNTEEALAGGAFGCPWMVVTKADGGKENFFGSDRMNVMAEFMGHQYMGPLRHLSPF